MLPPRRRSVPAVAVEVHEGRKQGATVPLFPARRQADLGRHIPELAARKALVEVVAGQVGDQHVKVAIAVEVADENAAAAAEVAIDLPVVVQLLGMEAALCRHLAVTVALAGGDLALGDRAAAKPAVPGQACPGRLRRN